MSQSPRQPEWQSARSAWSAWLSRGVRVGAVGLLALVGGSSARAEAPRSASQIDARACQVAYQSGQEKERSGLLVEASQLFAACSEETCGVQLWQSCVAEGTQLHTAVPSVVPLVVDESGAPLIDVQVRMDGHVIASGITGRAIPVDPGTHEFSFANGTGVFASKRITLARGERNRAISVAWSVGPKARHGAASAVK